jgi:hypothetical protein
MNFLAHFIKTFIIYIEILKITKSPDQKCVKLKKNQPNLFLTILSKIVTRPALYFYE